MTGPSGPRGPDGFSGATGATGPVGPTGPEGGTDVDDSLRIAILLLFLYSRGLLSPQFQPLLNDLVNQIANATVQQFLVEYLTLVRDWNERKQLDDNLINRIVVAAVAKAEGRLPPPPRRISPNLTLLNDVISQLILAALYGGAFFPQRAQADQDAIADLGIAPDDDARQQLEKLARGLAQAGTLGVLGGAEAGAAEDPAASAREFLGATLGPLDEERFERAWRAVQPFLKRA